MLATLWSFTPNMSLWLTLCIIMLEEVWAPFVAMLGKGDLNDILDNCVLPQFGKVPHMGVKVRCLHNFGTYSVSNISRFTMEL